MAGRVVVADVDGVAVDDLQHSAVVAMVSAATVGGEMKVAVAIRCSSCPPTKQLGVLAVSMCPVQSTCITVRIVLLHHETTSNPTTDQRGCSSVAKMLSPVGMNLG